MAAEDVELGRLYLPADRAEGSSLPGVIFVHDVWGPSEHSEGFASRLAAQGFAVLAIDFYRNLGEVSIEDPGHFIRGLSDPEIMADVSRGLSFFASHPVTQGRRVGITGVCMGGTYTLLAACEVPGIAAAAPFYGMLSYDHGMMHDPNGRDYERKPRSPLEAARSLRCPLHACFGAADDFVPLADVRALESELEHTEEDVVVRVYEGAGHAFMNETRPAAFVAEAAEDAWTRLAAFFRDTLEA